MPEVNQYLFTNKELLELLVKRAGVSEGRWVLMANFGIGPAAIGPAVDQMSPGVAIVIGQMGIQRAQANVPEALSVDAAVVNRASST